MIDQVRPRDLTTIVDSVVVIANSELNRRTKKRILAAMKTVGKI